MRSRTLASAIGVAAVLGWAVAPAPAHAQSARYLAANCANCHGTDGHSAGGGGMPGLAGLSPTYFVEQMKAFRDGTRKATIMHQLAKGYTEQQIAELAEYFGRQQRSSK